MNDYNNLKVCDKKPVLQRVYHDFYRLIDSNLQRNLKEAIVELGSGIGKTKDIIPDCISTDIYDYPWINQVENAYNLNFKDSSISNLILFDVFHHLEYPGEALNEFKRVLVPSGRVLIFEPALSIPGFLVYGLAHAEPIWLTIIINWYMPPEVKNSNQFKYYAAQGNATRIFLTINGYSKMMSGILLIKSDCLQYRM